MGNDFSTLGEGDWIPETWDCVGCGFGVGMGNQSKNPEDPLVRGMRTRESRRKARLTARCLLPDTVCVPDMCTVRTSASLFFSKKKGAT